MKIKFVEKNYKIAERFKKVITEKLEKLSKYFGDDAGVTVACVRQNKIEKLEVTISNKGLLYRSEVSGENMYNNIDLALPKLERQIIRHRGKIRDSKKKLKNFLLNLLTKCQKQNFQKFIRKNLSNLNQLWWRKQKMLLKDLDIPSSSSLMQKLVK